MKKTNEKNRAAGVDCSSPEFVERFKRVVHALNDANAPPAISVRAIDVVSERLLAESQGKPSGPPDNHDAETVRVTTAICAALGDAPPLDGFFILATIKDTSPIYDAVHALGALGANQSAAALSSRKPEVMTMSEAGEIRAKVATIADATGCDRRTVRRALTEGADAIRTARARERLRVPVEDARYALDLSDRSNDEWIAAQARVDKGGRDSVEAKERGLLQGPRLPRRVGRPVTNLREKLRKAISSAFLADGADVLADVVHQVRSGIEADSADGPPSYLTDPAAARNCKALQSLLALDRHWTWTTDGKAALGSAVVALYVRLGDLRAD